MGNLFTRKKSSRTVTNTVETEIDNTNDLLVQEERNDFKLNFLTMSKTIAKGNPSVQLLNIEEKLTSKHRIRKCTLGRGEDYATEKVIMVVGATGAGKTTLINGLVNYMLGVTWEDNFRFQLIPDAGEATQRSQAHSQTKWITSYTLHQGNVFGMPYSLTVIDTPGFGDTSGIKRDQEITEQIRTFFITEGDDGIDHIDAIGFVTQASLPRLTPTQRYIFDSILSLFGKDISDNIFLFATFADGQKVQAIAAIEEAGIKCKQVFKFNNSALYASKICKKQYQKGASNISTDSDEEDNFDKMFWKMGEKSFAAFFKSLNKTESKSLVLTKNVLEERQRLETYVTGIHQQIFTGLNKLEQLRIESDVLKTNEAEIARNKNFEYNVTEEAVRKVNTPHGIHITNCLNCNFTCHYPCKIAEDEHKRACAAIDQSNGVCKACPSRCDWSVHKNMQYRFVVETIKKTKTIKELKARYKAASGEKLTTEKLIKKVNEEFETVQMQVLHYANEIKKSLNRLKEIALKPNPLSTVDYIDTLIETERSSKKPGYNDRLKQLMVVREKAETLQKVSNKTEYDPFEKYSDVLNVARKNEEKD